MRVAIRKLLINNVEAINNRVYEPSAAGPTLEMPYLVLREGVQSTSDPYKDYTTIYEVWPYVRRTTFQKVDNLSKEVISTLNRKRFDVNGVPHYIEYTGTITDDIVDDEWDALTRGLRFRVFSLAWLLHTSVEPDPVDAMKHWAEQHFKNIQTNPLHWNPTDEAPALYWRVASIRGVDPTNWGSWIRATLKGHLIAPAIEVRGKWIDLVVRQLALDTRTAMTDKSRMFFQSVSADSSYDPFGAGQITLEVRFGVLKERGSSPILKHAYFDSSRGGEVHVEE